MKKLGHILVIRFSAMGDVAMTVPVLAALQQQHPDLRITMLTRTFFKPLFSDMPKVQVFEADLTGRHKGLLGLWRLYREVVQLDIGAVADLHQVLRTTILKLYFSFSDIPFYQIDKGRKEKKALTAPKNKVFEPLKPTHQRYADVFERIGLPISLGNVSLRSAEPIPERAASILGPKVQKWIGIAPFAAFRGKAYPLEMMQEAIGLLSNTKKYKILLFGGGAVEKAKLDLVSQAGNCFNMAGQFSFTEELALISNLDLMVSMDSGNAHLAAIYGIPTVTLWGVTHPYAGFYPFGQTLSNALLADREQFPIVPTSVYGNKMPKGYEKAIAGIKPQMIFEKVTDLLETVRS
jgi:ADP-heptose:LPS heptosyltransferase